MIQIDFDSHRAPSKPTVRFGSAWRNLLMICCAAFGFLANDVQASLNHQVGPGSGVLLPQNIRGDCGTTVQNSDGTYENGYAWSNQAVAAPYYGAFAECYHGSTGVCAALVVLTQVGGDYGPAMDVYVWDDAGGVPGNVLCSKTGVDPGEIAFWPNLSTHVVPLDGCCTGEDWWVGCWGAWPGQSEAWYVGADLNGPGGCPLTNIAPGMEFPTGWQNVSIVWGATRAMGIGAQTIECNPVPVDGRSWGQIKQLF